jgi:hypothetical protein
LPKLSKRFQEDSPWEAHLAREASQRRLESSRAAPPRRKMQQGMLMLRWLPRYTHWPMFSVLTTSALLPGYTCQATPATFFLQVYRSSNDHTVALPVDNLHIFQLGCHTVVFKSKLHEELFAWEHAGSFQRPVSDLQETACGNIIKKSFFPGCRNMPAVLLAKN